MANTQVRVGGLWLPVGVQHPPAGPGDGGDTGGGNGGSTITHGEQLTLADVGPTTGLTPSGSVETSSDRQVIEGLDITGIVRVRHADVTIRNCMIRVNSLYGIEIPSQFNDTASFVAEHCEVVGESGQRSACVVHYGRWTMRRCLFYGCEDAVKIGVGGRQRLEECYVRDAYFLPPGDPHNDGVQAVGGSDCSIVRCRIEGPFQAQTSAIILQTNNAPLDGWTIKDNYLSGGAYTLYIRDKGTGHGPATNMTVTGNIWLQDSWQFGPVSLDEHPSWVWSNNRTTTGAAV